jgi:hypothetical protein
LISLWKVHIHCPALQFKYPYKKFAHAGRFGKEKDKIGLVPIFKNRKRGDDGILTMLLKFQASKFSFKVKL